MARDRDMRFLERMCSSKQLRFYNDEGVCLCFFCEAGCDTCNPDYIHRSSYRSLLFYTRHGLNLDPGVVITKSHVQQTYDIEAYLRNISMRFAADSLLNICAKTAIDRDIDISSLPRNVYTYCKFYERYVRFFGTESLDLCIFPVMLRAHLGYTTDYFL